MLDSRYDDQQTGMVRVIWEKTFGGISRRKQIVGHCRGFKEVSKRREQGYSEGANNGALGYSGGTNWGTGRDKQWGTKGYDREQTIRH